MNRKFLWEIYSFSCYRIRHFCFDLGFDKLFLFDFVLKKMKWFLNFHTMSWEMLFQPRVTLVLCPKWVNQAGLQPDLLVWMQNWSTTVLFSNIIWKPSHSYKLCIVLKDHMSKPGASSEAFRKKACFTLFWPNQNTTGFVSMGELILQNLIFLEKLWL